VDRHSVNRARNIPAESGIEFACIGKERFFHGFPSIGPVVSPRQINRKTDSWEHIINEVCESAASDAAKNEPHAEVEATAGSEPQLWPDSIEDEPHIQGGLPEELAQV
tara:strand:+ start:265 stop:588 length:324 start_codon:yes stop_codon:yes gene_type:complete